MGSDLTPVPSQKWRGVTRGLMRSGLTLVPSPKERDVAKIEAIGIVELYEKNCNDF